jgi:hypothetical protein
VREPIRVFVKDERPGDKVRTNRDSGTFEETYSETSARAGSTRAALREGT